MRAGVFLWAAAVAAESVTLHSAASLPVRRALLAQPAGALVVALAGRRGLVLALLLVGYGLTRATLKAVGVRPLVQAVLLWTVATAVALALVLGGVA